METKTQQPAPEEIPQDKSNVVAQEDSTTEADDARETAAPDAAWDPADLQAQIEQHRQQAEERLDHLQRLQAEFSNYRRRMSQECLQAVNRGKEEVILALLPILNNFRLALQHAEQDANAVRQGVQMIWQQCEDFLHHQGVEPVKTVGHPFDPTQHEALSTAPATAETPANTVIAEISAGYTLNGHLLRPAQVVVTTAAEQTIPPQTEATQPPQADT
jgi:molecular chaperone GrpE